MSLSCAEWAVKTLAVMAKKVLGAGTTLKFYCFILLLSEGEHVYFTSPGYLVTNHIDFRGSGHIDNICL